MNNPGEETVTCPYNKAHVLLKSRIQFHLARCRAQFPDMEKNICPFNTTHIVNNVEMKIHIDNCPDRGIVDNFVMRQSSEVRPVEVLPVQSFNLGSNDDEVWDDEPVHGPSVLEQQEALAKQKAVLRLKSGGTQAERKNHRFDERRRHAELSGSVPEVPTARPTPAPAPAPAPPQVQYPKAEAVLQDMPEPKFVHPVQPQSRPIPANPWSGGRSNAPQVGNASDFPSLGTKGSRRDNDNSVQDYMNNLTLDCDRNERPNAWGKPAPRQQDARIAVPAGGLGGGGNRSQANPWGRAQQPVRPAPSAPAENIPTMPQITPDDFPSLVMGGAGRKKVRN